MNTGAKATSALGARISRCPRCALATWSAPDAHTCWRLASVDPAALDPAAELVALIAGASTYRVWSGGGERQLTYRGPEEIAATPASPRVVVVASHRCGAAMAGTALALVTTAPIPFTTMEVPF